ncbi:hypothetical protein HaLaN_13319, partial [Haematococcus lacustris]
MPLGPQHWCKDCTTTKTLTTFFVTRMALFCSGCPNMGLMRIIAHLLASSALTLATASAIELRLASGRSSAPAGGAPWPYQADGYPPARIRVPGE